MSIDPFTERVNWLSVPLLLAALYWPHVRSAAWTYEDGRAQTGAFTSWSQPRALTAWTWTLTTTPQSAHALSVGLHLGVVALLGALAWRLGYSKTGVGLVALLGAVHPLTVESVAYAASRSELLAALGVQLAVLCAAGRWWRPWPILGMVAGAVVGWLSKETAVVVVALVPLTIWVRRLKAPSDSAAVFGMAVGALWVLAGAWVIGIPSDVVNIGEAAEMRVTWLPWLLLQSAAAFRLIGLSVLPVGLTVDPDIDIIPVVLQWCALGSLVGLAVLTGFLARSRPMVAYGLAWCLLAIIPRLIVQTPRSYLQEHQFYLPIMGLILAGVAAWEHGEPDR